MIPSPGSQRTESSPSRPAGRGDLSGTRILVVMPSIPLQGMERANIQIMKMMRQRGAEVLFLTERTWGERMRREVEGIGCRWAPIDCLTRLRIPRTPWEAALMLTGWARTAAQIDAVYRSFRPTHVHVTNLTYLLLALPTLARARQPVVFRLPNPPDGTLRGARQALSNWIWRRVVTNVCDVVVCNCEYTRARVLEAGVSPAKVRLIYNCVPERSRPVPSDAPRLHPRRFNVVYLSKISAHKGAAELFDVALRVVRERDDVDFWFVGEHHWMNPIAEGLMAAVRARALESRIHFPGIVDDVFGLFEQCQLHVAPSVSSGESFPNAVLEAKAAGIPSVVFPTAGLPEAVTHLVDGYVCRERSADALYEGVRYFLDHPDARQVMGEAARRSLERFSAERAAEEWAALFAEARSA